MDEMDRMDEMDASEQHAPPIAATSAPVLLGGGSGHTGSRLLRRLLAEGRFVAAITRSAARLDWAWGLGDLRVIEADLRDPGAPAKIAAELAAQFGQPAHLAQPGESQGAGVKATQAAGGQPAGVRVTEGAPPAGVGAYIQIANIAFAERAVEIARACAIPRLICMSSTRRFTRFPDPVAERVLAGEAVLERAGAPAEKSAAGWAVPSPLGITILRPSMIYGGARDNNLEKLVRWMERPGLGRVVPVTAGGRAQMQPIFVDDLVEAIVRAMDRPAETSGRALTLAGPEPVSWRGMIETLAAEMIRAGRIRRAPLILNIPYPALFAAAGAVELLAGVLARAGVPRARALVRRDQIRRLMEDKTFSITEASEALDGWTPLSFAEGARLKISGWDRG